MEREEKQKNSKNIPKCVEKNFLKILKKKLLGKKQKEN